MSLHWGGEFLSQILPPGLYDRLHEAHVDPEYDFSGDEGFVQCDGESGEVILLMKGVMPRRVSRRRLKGLMGEGIDVEVSCFLFLLSRRGCLPVAMDMSWLTFRSTTKR